jgi:leader peptidase (prepilin peptidase) / N-methyltransferase
MAQVLIFIIGLVWGSFLNAFIWRLYSNKSIVRGRSQCPHCQHQLGFWDLIPLASFVFLRGHCRYCYVKISWQYPVVELVSACGFLLISQMPIAWLEKSWLMGIFFLGLMIFVYDLKYLLIPDISIILGVIWIAGYILLLNRNQLVNSLIAALAASLFFFILYYFSGGRWIGGGDVKLGFLMGLFLGWPNILLALLLAYIFGAIIGLSLIIFKQATLKSQVPFGPFLIVATLLVHVYGEEMIQWYTALLGG